MKKPLHILIDGADGLGKTTICQIISEELGLPVVKMQGMPEHFKKDPEAASEVYNKTVIQFNQFSFIQDRGWTSSLMYSSVYNRPIESLNYFRDVVGKLDEEIVILYGEKPFRGDDLITEENWKKLNSMYRDWEPAKSENIKVHKISVDGKSPYDIAREILVELKLRP